MRSKFKISVYISENVIPNLKLKLDSSFHYLRSAVEVERLFNIML